MPRNVYYGEHGEYGPYTPREYDLPDAGEVLEDYRCRALMTVQEFVDAYNKAVIQYNGNQNTIRQKNKHIPTITRNLVYKWEKHDMVPTDPKRRRIIAGMLHIPLALFGIASAEEIGFRVAQQAVPIVITQQAIDLTYYEENVLTFWRFHYTSTAQREWYAITKAIKELEIYEQQFRGSLQRNVREILYCYYLLAARIIRENQRNFVASYSYANQAVRVAKSLQKDARNKVENTEMGWFVARAQYSRGYIKLVWGLYNTNNQQNLFTINRDKIQDAIADFEEAEKQAAPSLRGNLYSELARAQGYGRRSNTDVLLARSTMDRAEKWIGVGSIEDEYIQILRGGRLGGFNQGSYLLSKAIVLDAVGYAGQAIETLQMLEDLKIGRIPSDYTRESAWMNIIWAQAALNQKDFYTSVVKAKSALLMCRDIHAVGNIAIIRDLYQHLLTTSYRNEQDMKELKQLLSEHDE